MAISLPSRSADRRVLSEINVTPLVDVMLVLLVIFMVTAPMLQRGTDVQLPQAQHSEAKEHEQLTLTLARDGRIYLNGEEVPRAALRDRLIEATRGRERSVQVAVLSGPEGEAAVQVGQEHVVEVLVRRLDRRGPLRGCA